MFKQNPCCILLGEESGLKATLSSNNQVDAECISRLAVTAEAGGVMMAQLLVFI